MPAPRGESSRSLKISVQQDLRRASLAALRPSACLGFRPFTPAHPSAKNADGWGPAKAAREWGPLGLGLGLGDPRVTPGSRLEHPSVTHGTRLGRLAVRALFSTKAWKSRVGDVGFANLGPSFAAKTAAR